MDTQRVVQRGIAMVAGGRRVFPNLTVLENLKIARTCARTRKASAPIWSACICCSPGSRNASWQLAGTLSGGEQQMLAVGRALMTRPKLMMMDEPPGPRAVVLKESSASSAN
jgi:branched-chain amino acid transport system ATP-binding protein